MTWRRCHGCGFFYPKHERACSECGQPETPINKALVMGKLNSALYAEAARATATA